MHGCPCRFYRVVPATVYLRYFASDRSHMRREDGSWIAPPPSQPPLSSPLSPSLGLPAAVHNLPLYLDLRADDIDVFLATLGAADGARAGPDADAGAAGIDEPGCWAGGRVGGGPGLEAEDGARPEPGRPQSAKSVGGSSSSRFGSVFDELQFEQIFLTKGRAASLEHDLELERPEGWASAGNLALQQQPRGKEAVAVPLGQH